MSRKCFIISVAFAFNMMLWTTLPAQGTGKDLTTISQHDSGKIILGSFAPCETLDLRGTWGFKMGSSDELDTCWESGDLTISSGGIIQRGKYVDGTGSRSRITGGQLTVYPGCVIEGTIQTSNGILYLEAGAILEEGLVFGKAGN